MTLDLLPHPASLGKPPHQDIENLLSDSFPNSIKRVLLINPPDGDASLFSVAAARRQRYHNYPPYGLAVLAQHLRDIEIEPDVLNLNHEILVNATHTTTPESFDFDAQWQRLLDQAVSSFRPDLIGITCMFTMTHKSLKNVIQYAQHWNIPIAVGGVHTSNDASRVLRDIPEVDFAFLREADHALPQFCKVANGEAPIKSLSQLIINSDPPHSFLTEDQPGIETFDTIPAFDLIKVKDLAQYGLIGVFHSLLPKAHPTATILSNRGCRAQCTFCSVPRFNGRVVRQRPIESVLNEAEALAKAGVKHLVWLDDDLLKDHKRAIALFRQLKARNLGLSWDATNGLIAASCTEEVVQAMAESGCTAVNIGMESGNPKILKEIRKPGTVKTFIKAAEVFQNHPEIHARLLLMLGFPGETMSMLQDTFNAALKMDLDWCSLNPLQALPGTAIYDDMVAKGLLSPVSNALNFMSGGYGKQDKIDQKASQRMAGFQHVVDTIGPDTIPSKDQIHDIWFYMTYHLNFHRIYHEERPEKIKQLLAHLATLSDTLSPDHGLALYFSGYLQYKSRGSINPEIIVRLRNKLNASSYWANRFAAFRMSIDDLVNCHFPNEHLPKLTLTQEQIDKIAASDDTATTPVFSPTLQPSVSDPPPLLAFTMPSKNRASMLDSLLKALVPFCELHGIPIFVSDNASTDHTPEVCKRWAEKWTGFTYQRHPEPISFGESVMSSARMSTGTYTWVIGNDDYIHPEGILRVLSTLKNHNPDAVVVGTREVPSLDTIDLSRELSSQMTPLFPVPCRDAPQEIHYDAASFFRKKTYDLPVPSVIYQTSDWHQSGYEVYLETHHAHIGGLYEYLAAKQAQTGSINVVELLTPFTVSLTMSKPGGKDSWSDLFQFLATEGFPKWFSLLPKLYGPELPAALEYHQRIFRHAFRGGSPPESGFDPIPL